jgi:hypothetical protein
VQYSGLSADGYDDKTQSGPALLTLTTTFVDGSKESIILLERSADSYFIDSSDYKNFFIDKEQVDQLVTTWEALIHESQ